MKNLQLLPNLSFKHYSIYIHFVSYVMAVTKLFYFILRGVSLLGIDAGETPMNLRCQIWNKLASEWKFPQLKQLSVDCDLGDLGPEIDKILSGGQRGRIVVNLQ